MSRHTKLHGAPKARGPRPWPTWPMCKFVTGHTIKYSPGHHHTSARPRLPTRRCVWLRCLFQL